MLIPRKTCRQLSETKTENALRKICKVSLCKSERQKTFPSRLQTCLLSIMSLCEKLAKGNLLHFNGSFLSWRQKFALIVTAAYFAGTWKKKGKLNTNSFFAFFETM